MKGHYAGKSHAHQDSKRESKRRGPEPDPECPWCLIPEHAEFILDALNRPTCPHCHQEIVYDE